MKSLLLALLVFGAAVSPAAAFDAYEKPNYAQNGVPALALQAIEVAQQELHKVKPDWQNYQVQAAQTADTLIVSMWQPSDPVAGVALSPSQANLVVVVLDRATLKVTNVRQGHI